MYLPIFACNISNSCQLFFVCVLHQMLISVLLLALHSLILVSYGFIWNVGYRAQMVACKANKCPSYYTITLAPNLCYLSSLTKIYVINLKSESYTNLLKDVHLSIVII